MKSNLLSIFFIILFSLISSPLLAQSSFKDTYQKTELAQDFPIKGSLVHRVEFWKKVYTEITSKEAFLHDSEDLSIIYKKVDLPSSRRSRIRFLKKERRNMKSLLRSIAKKGGTNLTSKEQEVYEKVSGKKISEIKQLARNLRFQYGLRDRYYKGLIRSYEYLDYIKSIFKKLGLPDELVYLPHVESSFNYNAYSKVGAAGIWQFMRSTARIYKLKVNYVVDERRDVIKATKAAARLLRDNYGILKSWPLALTAYNHGARSIQRAVSKLGTKDIHRIIDEYGGRRFGFASKNFYATFMATVLISRDPGKYFKEFTMPKVFKYSVLNLNKAYTVAQIAKELKISIRSIGKYNPSIRSSALKSPLFLPKDFNLHIPRMKPATVKQLQARINKLESTRENFNLDRLHIISRGENLYDISRAYNVTLNDLIAFNQINNPSRIYAGMKLKIPGKNTKVSKVVAKLETKIAPKEKITQPKDGPSITAQKPSANSVADTAIAAKKAVVTPSYGPDLPKDLSSLEGHQLDTVKKSKGIYQITIETDETLGHIAEWANLRTQKIRNLNRLSFGRSIHLGQKLKIQLSQKNLINFKQSRNEYHLSIQEDFFNSFKVTGTEEYKVKKGDTISGILKKLELPFWLLRRYQKDQKLSDQLNIGQSIIVPQTEALEDSVEPPTSQSLSEEL